MSIYVSSPENTFQSLIYNNQGAIFSNSKDTFKAKKSYKKSLQVQVNSVKAYNNLGADL